MPRGVLLGCIADDFTGATDLANTLVRQGMRTTQVIGVPEENTPIEGVDAVVVALKSRSCPPEEAIRVSKAALSWLRRQRARQFFFKYCSTFDSTDRGNIGPVADALLADLEDDFAIVCPAFPTNGRTVFNGHHFVGTQLLSDSGMRDHPVTPMTESDLVRVLGRQTDGKVGLVPYAVVRNGSSAIVDHMTSLQAGGCRYAVVDAITDVHLMAIGEACADHQLITGGSGVALGLPDNFRRRGLLADAARIPMPKPQGAGAVLSGSCSQMTLTQVALTRESWPSFAIDPLEMAGSQDYAEKVLTWASDHVGDTPILIYSTADPEIVARVQSNLGRSESGSAIEHAMGEIARGLIDMGVRRLVVAGGETSGAVTQALGIDRLQIGPEIDPGVPWCEASGTRRIALALKSGNFGAETFFAKAFEMLP